MKSARIILLFGVFAGCLEAPRFPCVSDRQCQNGTLAGVCEANGMCSFPDAACAGLTGRKYASIAAGDATQALTNTCVPRFCEANPVTDVALGARHTCVVRARGTVECWGDNESGQLGDGTTTPSTSPRAVVGLSVRAVAVTAGEAHTCARGSAGEIWCWGDNTFGQLGDGTLQTRVTAASINPASLRMDLVVAGARSTCALAVDTGRAYCWGDNRMGQIGNPNVSLDRVPRPTPQDAAPAFTSLALRGSHACAVSESFRVFCWGDDRFGQLGLSTPAEPTRRLSFRAAPTGVPLTVDVQSVSVGHEHTCALLVGGQVTCWGNDADGQLGRPATAPGPAADVAGPAITGFHAPQVVPGLPATANLVLGGWHSCAVAQDASVRCWGANNFGQLGTGARGDRLRIPTVVAPGSAAGAERERFHAGAAHACVQTRDGYLRCWGDNRNGRLGHGPEIVSPRALPVPLLEGVTALAAGADQACAVAEASLWCWGAGAVVAGTDMPFPTPALIPGPVTGVAVGGTDACALVGGQLWCRGPEDVSSGHRSTGAWRAVPTVADAVAVALGRAHGCVLSRAGIVSCWQGPSADAATPVVALTDPIAEIVAGADHTCARTRLGLVSCWGRGADGQLGNGETRDATAPVDVPLTAYAVDLAAGRTHTCAALENGQVHCWGRAVEGQLGLGGLQQDTGDVRTFPVVAAAITNAIAVQAGEDHTCVIGDDGDVRCFGGNGHGQLGNGETSGAFVAAAPAANGAIAVAAGRAHTCALYASGTVSCWGSDDRGQLGRGRSLVQPDPRFVALDCR